MKAYIFSIIAIAFALFCFEVFGVCAHHHDSRYAKVGHGHNYDNLELGEPLVLRPRPRPNGRPHCYLRTYGEKESYDGRCIYTGDVVTSVVGGRVYCSRTYIHCDYSDYFFRKFFN
jgi:hypothetical protein